MHCNFFRLSLDIYSLNDLFHLFLLLSPLLLFLLLFPFSLPFKCLKVVSRRLGYAWLRLYDVACDVPLLRLRHLDLHALAYQGLRWVASQALLLLVNHHLSVGLGVSHQLGQSAFTSCLFAVVKAHDPDQLLSWDVVVVGGVGVEELG